MLIPPTVQYVILGADGSALVFDYPDGQFFTAAEQRVQNTIMMANAGGEPMQSAFSYAELEKHGFLIYELLTPEDIQKNIIDRAGADMKAFEHINDCLAVRKEMILPRQAANAYREKSE